MTKTLPGENFLAEPLRSTSARQPTLGQNWKPHLRNLGEIARREYLQDLDCNLGSFVLTLPYFSEPAFVSRVFRPIAAGWDLYRPRDQSMVPTYLAQ